MQVLPEEKSLLILMVVYEDMDEEHFLGKILQKWIDQQHTWQDM
jgi:hypothetical protein